jgi:glucokinase
MAIIALDVGGSSVKHGLVEHPPDVTVEQTPINSQGSAEEIIGTLATIIASYPAATPVAFGFPSPFDYQQGISYIHGLAKYEQIYGVNVRQALRDALNAPDLDIRFRNDAEAAIVGEAIYGSGVTCSRTIGVTLGTGFGSAFLVDGKPVTDESGVPEDGKLYPYPAGNGRADDVFSTRGLLERFAEANVPVMSVEHADPDDVRVQQVYYEFGHQMGEFLQPFVSLFEADCLLVLGGISNAFEWFSTDLIRALPGVRVLRGTLGARAAVLGAAHLYQED